MTAKGGTISDVVVMAAHPGLQSTLRLGRGYTWSIEQTNSRAFHFRPPKSRFGPSEAVEAKSDATVRLGLAISTGPPRFATIRDQRRVDRRVTDMWKGGQTEVGVPERSRTKV